MYASWQRRDAQAVKVKSIHLSFPSACYYSWERLWSKAIAWGPLEVAVNLKKWNSDCVPLH